MRWRDVNGYFLALTALALMPYAVVVALFFLIFS